MGELQEIATYCAQCKSKCGVVALVRDDDLIAVRPDRAHPNCGFCTKGAAAPDIVRAARRLRTPLRRTTPKSADDPGWEPIDWDEALSTVAARLLALQAEYGAESVMFSRPAPGASHATDWAPFLERLARAFGSPNVITTGHICNWGRDSGSAYTFGSGLPTPHFEAARTILLWGHNPAVSHHQNWRRIREAQQRGARLLVVDPRRTEATDRADLWVRLRPGTDAALALGLIHWRLEQGCYDAEFLTRWTNAPFFVDLASGRFLRAGDLGLGGEDAFVVWDGQSQAPAAVDVGGDPARWGITPALEAPAEVVLPGGRRAAVKSALTLLRERAAAYPPARVAALTGVPAEQVTALAAAVSAPGPLCYYTYNGVEQHVDTAQTNRALCILYALSGDLEAEGGNVSLPGPKAQGVAGRDLLSRAQTARRVGLAARPLGAPRNSVQAYNFYDAALSGEPYPVRGLVCFGGNLLLQNGDTRHGRKALESLDFYVHMDLFENPTARFADILLPATTPWESPCLSTSFAGGPATAAHMQYRPAVISPRHQSRSDLAVIFDLAVRLGLGDHFWAGDLEAAFAYQLATTGLTLEEVRAAPRGITLPVTQRFRRYAEADAESRVRGFATPTRKVEIYSEQFLTHGYDPLPDAPAPSPWSGGQDAAYPLTLTSSKLLQYCHSQGRGIPALRHQVPEPYVELHPDTARDRQVSDGEWVALTTATGSIRVKARLTDKVPPGVVATQTGWWEPCDPLGLPGYDPFDARGANVNLIMTNDVLDPISGSVPVKSYPCTLVKVREEVSSR